jgi:hypothetical protein
MTCLKRLVETDLLPQQIGELGRPVLVNPHSLLPNIFPLALSFQLFYMFLTSEVCLKSLVRTFDLVLVDLFQEEVVGNVEELESTVFVAFRYGSGLDLGRRNTVS